MSKMARREYRELSHYNPPNTSMSNAGTGIAITGALLLAAGIGMCLAYNYGMSSYERGFNDAFTNYNDLNGANATVNN